DLTPVRSQNELVAAKSTERRWTSRVADFISPRAPPRSRSHQMLREDRLIRREQSRWLCRFQLAVRPMLSRAFLRKAWRSEPDNRLGKSSGRRTRQQPRGFDHPPGAAGLGEARVQTLLSSRPSAVRRESRDPRIPAVVIDLGRRGTWIPDRSLRERPG